MKGFAKRFLIMTLFLTVVANAFAFDVTLTVYNRWNGDGSNIREYGIQVNNFQGLNGGSLPDSVTDIVLEFYQTGSPTATCSFSYAPYLSYVHGDMYQGNGEFFDTGGSDSCMSTGGSGDLVTGLRDDGEYRVTVITDNGEVHTSAPAVDSISTYRVFTPAVPTSPSNGEVLLNNTPTLTWDAPVNQTDGATLYSRVVMYRTDTWERVISDWSPGATDNSFTVGPGVLEEGVEYSWHIRSYDGTDYSSGQNISRSNYWTFTAGPATDAIPTLSEWGMIILSIILGATAFYAIRKRSIETMA